MRLRWRTFWFLVGGWLLLGGLCLVWRLPDQGFFRLALHPLELPPDGVALVELRQGQPGNSYASQRWASAGAPSGRCGR